MSEINLRRELARQGIEPPEIARLIRARQLTRVRRGAYAGPPAESMDARAAHRLLLEAIVRQCSPDAVVSHTSAGALHDLPMLDEQLDRVHLTRDRRGGGRRDRQVQVHGSPIAAEEIMLRHGFRVTDLARTVLDLACLLPIEQAIMAGDAALRQGLDRIELAERLSDFAGRSGVGKARIVVPFLDARSESAGESWSRWVFHSRGVPTPEPQFEVCDSRGRLIGRADFGWREQRTLGEFDGKMKYGRLLKPGQRLQDVLVAEKHREDALRDAGWQVVRWIWSELYRPDELLERLDRAFARGGEAL